jgi:hypothetical protein
MLVVLCQQQMLSSSMSLHAMADERLLLRLLLAYQDA